MGIQYVIPRNFFFDSCERILDRDRVGRHRRLAGSLSVGERQRVPVVQQKPAQAWEDYCMVPFGVIRSASK